jgi:hypothetical protein
MTERGWAERSADGSTTYYAPDATLLLTEEFTNQHCFGVDRTDEGIILTFEPNRERRGVPELEGEMILDPVSLELAEIRFRYVGLPVIGTGRLGAEGEVLFYAAPNGLRIVREWAIRMPVATVVRTSFRGQAAEDLRIDHLREEGGRVLRVRTRGAEILLGPAGPASSDVGTPPEGRLVTWSADGQITGVALIHPLADRLVTWSADDQATGGVALFLRNELPEAIVVTGIELRACINVALSCDELQPARVPVGPAQEARLLLVPREDPSFPVGFLWDFSATAGEPPSQPGR